MAHITVDDFFEEHSDKKHYSNLQPRPEQYSDWRNAPEKVIGYARWIQTKSDVPSLRMLTPVPRAEEMAQESENLLDEFIKHRGDIHPGWHSLTIHGSGKHITEDWDAPIYEGRWTSRPKYDWTEIADQCPAIVDWLQNYWSFSEFHRVRLMLLEPGGYIRPHKDFDTRRLAAYNFALTNPPGCEFCMEDSGLIPWQAGECRAIDIGRLHSVRNIGTQNRVHMIIHGLNAPEHNKMLCASYDNLLQEQGML